MAYPDCPVVVPDNGPDKPKGLCITRYWYPCLTGPADEDQPLFSTGSDGVILDDQGIDLTGWADNCEAFREGISLVYKRGVVDSKNCNDNDKDPDN